MPAAAGSRPLGPDPVHAFRTNIRTTIDESKLRPGHIPFIPYLSLPASSLEQAASMNCFQYCCKYSDLTLNKPAAVPRDAEAIHAMNCVTMSHAFWKNHFRTEFWAEIMGLE
jgi:hypothetical protein